MLRSKDDPSFRITDVEDDKLDDFVTLRNMSRFAKFPVVNFQVIRYDPLAEDLPAVQRVGVRPAPQPYYNLRDAGVNFEKALTPIRKGRALVVDLLGYGGEGDVWTVCYPGDNGIEFKALKTYSRNRKKYKSRRTLEMKNWKAFWETIRWTDILDKHRFMVPDEIWHIGTQSTTNSRLSLPYATLMPIMLASLDNLVTDAPCLSERFLARLSFKILLSLQDIFEFDLVWYDLKTRNILLKKSENPQGKSRNEHYILVSSIFIISLLIGAPVGPHLPCSYDWLDFVVTDLGFIYEEGWNMGLPGPGSTNYRPPEVVLGTGCEEYSPTFSDCCLIISQLFLLNLSQCFSRSE
ncbi:MAG: hypothetical protein KVP17_005003 [Porospora cf. gigantea B]|uniref:uncharacterized protein n=1 Tax=Porospora cf. gigantea B TaxID=2853592 RepID=UPI003571C0CA|nr:MAG: hypothetical protein KVP17_005003 [Porospora cf. gigantea B]